MPYSNLFTLKEPIELSTTEVFSDYINIDGNGCEIQISVTGDSVDSDDVEIYQYQQNSNDGVLLGSISLDGDNEQIKSFYILNSKSFKIGFKMTSASSETPICRSTYVTNDSILNERYSIPSPEFTGFTFTVKTDNTGTSNDNQFTLPLKSGQTYNCVINWGDGTSTTQTTDVSPTHTYPAIGTYTIEITGTFPAIYFNFGGDAQKLTTIIQWGNIAWGTFESAFAGCSQLTSVSGSTANTSSVTTMIAMFRDCSSMTSVDVGGFDTALVTDMSFVFFNCSSLISAPDVSGFNTAIVTDMSSMFRNCSSMTSTPDVSGFNTGSVTAITYMFYACSSITSPPNVSGFNTSSITSLAYMFGECSSMVSAPDVSGFDTALVTSLTLMFFNCSSMTSAPDVSGFDTGLVTNMSSMFLSCTSLTFNVNIGSWDVTALTNAASMFAGATIPTTNYDNLLIGWESQAVNNGVALHGGNSQYSAGAAATARAALIADHTWAITDNGQAP